MNILVPVINGNASNQTPTYDAEPRPCLRVLLITADLGRGAPRCQALRELEVAGEVASVDEGMLTASATQPDLVVLDISVARTTVAGIVFSILARTPATKIAIPGR